MVRLTVFIRTSRAFYFKEFESFRKVFLWHRQITKCLLKWPCVWVLRRGHLSALWRVCPGKGGKTSYACKAQPLPLLSRWRL